MGNVLDISHDILNGDVYHLEDDSDKILAEGHLVQSFDLLRPTGNHHSRVITGFYIDCTRFPKNADLASTRDGTIGCSMIKKKIKKALPMTDDIGICEKWNEKKCCPRGKEQFILDRDTRKWSMMCNNVSGGQSYAKRVLPTQYFPGTFMDSKRHVDVDMGAVVCFQTRPPGHFNAAGSYSWNAKEKCVNIGTTYEAEELSSKGGSGNSKVWILGEGVLPADKSPKQKAAEPADPTAAPVDASTAAPVKASTAAPVKA